MSTPHALSIVLLGPPRFDGSGAVVALLRRALARPEWADADVSLVLGDLTAHGLPVEGHGLRAALAATRRPIGVVPGPADVPRAGRPPSWLGDWLGAEPWPRVASLADGRAALVEVDALGLGGEAGAVGDAQLTELDETLGALPEETRRVVALAGRPDGGAL